jgi:hypothetical protein
MYQKNTWSWQTLEKINFWKFCGGKKQIGFDWNLFGTPGTIPHPSPVLVFVDNLVRPKIASREPCKILYWMNEYKRPRHITNLPFFTLPDEPMHHRSCVNIHGCFTPRALYMQGRLVWGTPFGVPESRPAILRTNMSYLHYPFIHLMHTHTQVSRYDSWLESVNQGSLHIPHFKRNIFIGV